MASRRNARPRTRRVSRGGRGAGPAPRPARKRGVEAAGGVASLDAMVDARGRLLEATALAGGLPRVRLRSSPERLAWEAARFLEALAQAAAAKDVRAVRAIAAREVRSGALAAAEPEEVPAVFATWRRALQSFAATFGTEDHGETVGRALLALEKAAAAEARAWSPERIDVITMGASAGGIQSLTEVLATLPPSLPATVLIVLHLSPQTPSLLPEVLARRARVTIAPALEDSQLYLGSVYVAPPGRHLVVGARALHLADGPPVHFVRPSADVLFESAASNHGLHLASVVLSGTGADGATGTRAVHERGGITLAEDPRFAEFGGMPEAAIATGAIDHVLPRNELGELLRALCVRGRAALRRRGR